MPTCPNCGSPSKNEGWVCLECYNQKKNGSKEESSTLQMKTEKENGLSSKERNFRYSMIKGRIAETLIQELFLSLGYTVFRYGMENTIPGIMELLKGVRSDVALHIRRMPDFVVQNPRNGEVHFVEVKFRASETFTEKDLKEDYPYDNAFIVLVSKKHIKCISVTELRAGREISTTSRNYFGSRKEFELDKDVIIEFCDFAVQFFANIEEPKTRN